jgi:hypothetical protein
MFRETLRSLAIIPRARRSLRLRFLITSPLFPGLAELDELLSTS